MEPARPLVAVAAPLLAVRPASGGRVGAVDLTTPVERNVTVEVRD